MSDDVLTAADRDALWETIATVRDAAPRTPDDADTDAIIDAIVDSGLLHRIAAAQRAVAWDQGFLARGRSSFAAIESNPHRATPSPPAPSPSPPATS